MAVKFGSTGKGVYRAGEIAEGYCVANNIRYNKNMTYDQVPSRIGKDIADFYELSWHEPHRPDVQLSYAMFAHETAIQYRYIVESGITFEPWLEDGQPYANSTEMIEDVRENNHLYFFLTSSGYGEDDFDDYHPMLEKSGVILDGIELCYNDLFRAVHDFFGHAVEGFSFGPRGEHNAWRKHVAMYSEIARGAMSWETRGQNSWVNFGPHLRREDGTLPEPNDPDYVPLYKRPYAEQKANVLPRVYTRP